MINQHSANTWSYTQIVVAVDQSKPSQKAFEQALAIAKAFQAKLHLLHILAPLQEEFQDLSSLALDSGYYPTLTNESLEERWSVLEREG